MMKTFPDFPEVFDENERLTVHYGEHKVPVDLKVLESILQEIENEQDATFSTVELVYVDEHGIVDINKEHLGRDYITDIISFRYDESDDAKAIEGTLYCCAPRISEQSREVGTTEAQEFYRIFIHGLLHLTGYNDQTVEEKAAMTRLENHYLELFNL
jgi:rRNA maturation RNase YbeY